MEPFLKWAGGKRWLVRSPDFRLPGKFERYVEPFLGSGAVLFAISPTSGIVNDRNDDLMNFYDVLCHQPDELKSALRRHQDKHSESYYYTVRSQPPVEKLEKAARFLYLNRACWNGLYRVNRQGRFNVPKGTKERVFFESDDYIGASKLLKNMELRSEDFEKIVDGTGEGDFLFVDPPYTVKHNSNGFLKYNERIFSWEDQIRLADSLRKAVSRGCIVLVTNADNDSVRELYDFASYRSVKRASVIAGSSKARTVTSEALFTANY